MPKLNQILAIEKGVKTRENRVITDLHKNTQKPQLLNGFHKEFQPIEEGGETYPAEHQVVQLTCEQAIEEAKDQLVELFDITATKDWANTEAKADISIDGEVLLTQVPATYMLFLEKQLADIRTFVDKMVELDTSVEWRLDDISKTYKSEPITQHRTAKVQEAIVLYDATEQHPAQTQLISKDVVVGHWKTVKASGAMSQTRKKELLGRIDKITKAVKFAREEANGTETKNQTAGDKVLGYIFK